MATDHNQREHKPIERELFVKALKGAQKAAAEIIEELGVEQTPILVGLRHVWVDGEEGFAGKVMPVGPFINAGAVGKDALVEVIRTLLTNRTVDIVCLAHEAWMSTVDVPKAEAEGKPLDEIIGNLPNASDDPDRQEVLMIILYSLDEQYTIPHPITTKDGKRSFERLTLDDAFEARPEGYLTGGRFSLA